jgi:hypothetical protein
MVEEFSDHFRSISSLVLESKRGLKGIKAAEQRPKRPSLLFSFSLSFLWSAGAESLAAAAVLDP